MAPPPLPDLVLPRRHRAAREHDKGEQDVMHECGVGQALEWQQVAAAMQMVAVPVVVVLALVVLVLVVTVLALALVMFVLTIAELMAVLVSAVLVILGLVIATLVMAVVHGTLLLPRFLSNPRAMRTLRRQFSLACSGVNNLRRLPHMKREYHGGRETAALRSTGNSAPLCPTARSETRRPRRCAVRGGRACGTRVFHPALGGQAF